MEALDFLVRHGYWLVFGVVLGEQLGLPLVGAPVLLAAGALAGMGPFSAPAVLAVAVGACLIGDLVWFHLGRRRGAAVLTFLCRISLEPDSCVRRTEDIFSRWGARALLVAKFVPGLNTVAAPLAGVTGMRPGRFLRYDAGGATLWAGAYVGLGYLFSTQIEAVMMGLARLGHWAGAVIGAALAAYIAWKFVQRRRFLRSLRMARVTPAEVLAWRERGEPLLIVDLRNAAHLASEGMRIPGALHLLPEDIVARHHEIARDREIVVYCS